MKTAIVTGAAAGIGKTCAEMLLQAGYTTIGFDIKKPDNDNGIIFVKGDLSSHEDRLALALAAQEAGNVRILVNVAGVAPKVRNDLLDMTEESYSRVTDINTKGTLFLTQAIARLMIKNEPVNGLRGTIVNISSCSAYTSSTNRGEYCVSKAGVSMITTLFADRLSSEDITVNEICPGIIRTDMTAGVTEKYDRLISEGLVPLGRWGTPEDVAKAVLTFTDGSLSYTTGQSLCVDGGMHIRRL